MNGRLRRRILPLLTALALAALMAFGSALSASALDDTYRFDEFGMTVKVPKNYTVITRDTPADDPAFSSPDMDYSREMKAFEQADIYLRAYDPDGAFRISLTVLENESSAAYGSYADLSDADRRAIADDLLKNDTVTSASPVKRGELYFIDITRESEDDDGEPVYISLCRTVVNGKQIDLTMQKSGEDISSSEAKALAAIASSIEFDRSSPGRDGLVFDWWRLLLWVIILVVITVVISLLTKYRSNQRRRSLEERRQKRARFETTVSGASDVIMINNKPVTFDEALGYHEGDRYSSRSATDLDSFDISVREKDPAHGVNYFEDEGKSIDDRTSDYFDTYFREPTPGRSGIARLFSTIGAYIGIALRHIGYFFRNLFRVFRRKKKKQ